MTARDPDAETRVSASPCEMPPSGHEILARLLELTPPPPQHAEVAQLLATFEAIVTERAALIATIVPPVQLTDADRRLLVELEHRHTAWQDVLTAAQRTVGDQRCGTHQLRAYARPV
jgi:hypothetical protein